MADLKTEFLARYSDARVRQLSNPDKVAPTAIDTVKLDKAVEDALADFRALVQIPYDEDETDHARVGVVLVEANLAEKGTATSSTAEGLRNTAAEKADALKLTAGGRGRPSVQTVVVQSQYKFSKLLPDVGNFGPDGRRLFGGSG